ncbi:MAG: EAL domain-containing protein [Marinobacterium sp.]|nr:EAL domain-containing protein [Marinobacterium sp.]
MLLKLRKKLIGAILLPIATIFFFAISVIGYLWIQSEYRTLETANEQYASEYIELHKAELRTEVTRVAQIIQAERRNALQHLQQRLKERINQAHHLTRSLHQRYHNQLSESQIQQKVLEALRYQRWHDNRHYFYVADMQGLERLYPPNPLLENRPVSEVFGQAGEEVLKMARKLINEQGEGLLSYPWHGGNLAQALRTKYSYVKHYAPWDWVIGTGEYLSEYEAELQARVLQRIATMRHLRSNTGYFFVVSPQGDVHTTRHRYYPEPPNMLTVQNSQGVAVIKENIRVATESPEGNFTRYIWPTENGKEAEKLVFVQQIEGWNLLLGTGIYLDQMQAELDARTARLNQQLGNRIQSVLLIFAVSLFVAAVAVYLVMLKLRANMQLFQTTFADSIDSRVHIHLDDISFDEFRQLANQANTMIDGLNQQAEELRYRAYHDHLTGLPNRMYGTRHLSETIEKARRHQGRVTLLFIDLDNFKEINDTLGHSTGDLLLKMVASRLQSVAQPQDMVARLGGDEFTIITDLVSNATHPTLIAEQVLALFSEPFNMNGQSLHITASIGLSSYPENGHSAELLLRNADSAMYRAKGEGKNGYSLYDRTMTDEVVNRVATVEALREAIEQQQFVLNFQPQIDITSGEVVGAEALIRWLHPDKGLLPPGHFIPCAEASGQITAIGRWVLRETCRTCVIWRNSGLDVPRIAVNISGLQLRDPHFSQFLENTLQSTGCSAQALELEITESVLMDNPEQSARTLENLQKLGVHISIDDFGTGYSSLSYLKRLPINKLKIDRSFIDELHLDGHDQAITRAIIALAQSLKLGVIAEGVENIEQLNRLRDLGCNLVQGYHFSRPLPEKEFLTYLEDASAELIHEEFSIEFDDN